MATVMSIRMMSEMLQKDIQELDMEVISGKLSTLTLQPTIFDGIKGAQELDSQLLKLKEQVLEGKMLSLVFQPMGFCISKVDYAYLVTLS